MRTMPASSYWFAEKKKLAARGFQKTDRRKTREHRNPKECGGLAFRKIRRAVDEVTEASIADLFGGVLYILGR